MKEKEENIGYLLNKITQQPDDVRHCGEIEEKGPTTVNAKPT